MKHMPEQPSEPQTQVWREQGGHKFMTTSPSVTGVVRKGGEWKGGCQAHRTAGVAPDISQNCQHQKSTQASLIPAKDSLNGWQPPLTS